MTRAHGDRSGIRPRARWLVPAAAILLAASARQAAAQCDFHAAYYYYLLAEASGALGESSGDNFATGPLSDSVETIGLAATNHDAEAAISVAVANIGAFELVSSVDAFHDGSGTVRAEVSVDRRISVGGPASCAVELFGDPLEGTERPRVTIRNDQGGAPIAEFASFEGEQTVTLGVGIWRLDYEHSAGGTTTQTGVDEFRVALTTPEPSGAGTAGGALLALAALRAGRRRVGWLRADVT